jgi:hypothetical protein
MHSGLGRDEDEAYWKSVVSAGRRLFGRPEEYWQRIVDYAQTDIPTLRAMADELTDEDVLIAASRLFRCGAGHMALAPELRATLAELAITGSLAAEAWRRSVNGRRHFLASWHIGVSIGLGLTACSDGKLFGSATAPDRDRNGRSRTWAEWMDKELGAAHSAAAGKFRVHSRAVWAQFRELTGGKALR